MVGGVHTEYQNGILTASEVYTGSLTTAGAYTWPSDKWDAWGSYMATRTAADVPVATASGDGVILPGATHTGGTLRIRRWTMGKGALCVLAIALLGLF
jgi:carboxypeptidase D